MERPYEVRNSDVAGMGTFATRTIIRGQRIMSCQPLLLNRTFKPVPTIETLLEIVRWEAGSESAFEEAEFKRMTANTCCIDEVRTTSNRLDDMRQRIVGNVDDGDGSRSSEEEYTGLVETDLEYCLYEVLTVDLELSPNIQRRAAKFLCNRLFLDGHAENGNGLFREIWKVNHCCRPNAVATWNEETQRMNLHALRTILPGKEIFISYVPWDRLGFDVRAGWLWNNCYFLCKCKYCREPHATTIKETRETICRLSADCYAIEESLTRAPMKNAPFPKEELKTIKEYQSLYKSRIGKDVVLAHLYVLKARLLVRYGRTVDAWQSLHISYEIFSTCYGIDHPFTKGKFIMLQNVASRLKEPAIMAHQIDCLIGSYMLPETVQAPQDLSTDKARRDWLQFRTAAVKDTNVHNYPWHGLVPG